MGFQKDSLPTAWVNTRNWLLQRGEIKQMRNKNKLSPGQMCLSVEEKRYAGVGVGGMAKESNRELYPDASGTKSITWGFNI